MALGLERAGFLHAALVEIDADACGTLRHNRTAWHAVQADIAAFDAKLWRGIDLIAAGLPCPPFSVAGRQLGEADERNLFPPAFRAIGEVQPKAVLIENAPGLVGQKFMDYRGALAAQLRQLGYETRFELLNAADFGVPQNRQRAFIVALRPAYAPFFEPPSAQPSGRSVGDALADLMQAAGRDAEAWRAKACEVAPTLAGGSKKHGGADLGPTGAKRAWERLGVDGKGIADAAPSPGFQGLPRLTLRMAARLQGFPDGWAFTGKKTSAYRQIGNALPPALAAAIGGAVHKALRAPLGMPAPALRFG